MIVKAVILAAGKGKRMYSSLPKVFHQLAGKTLLERVITTALTVSHSLIIIRNNENHPFFDLLGEYQIKWVKQEQQLGTGHAVQQALPDIEASDRVMILCGDVPLITPQTLRKLIAETPSDALGMVTAIVDQPFGYGRIKRDANHQVVSVIEENDASDAEKAIKEVNASVYLIPGHYLEAWLPKLQNHNQQEEYYLTDIVALAAANKVPIQTIQATFLEEIWGVNDHLQLAHLERVYQKQQAEELMRQGVTLQDPARLDIRGTVKVGTDVRIDVNVILEGEVVIGNHCMIEANTLLRNVTLGDRVSIYANSVLEGVEVQSDCLIGPFARIRPGSVLHPHVRIGNFVEVKNSQVGERSKVNHLSYIGDSEIGQEVNVGAGTITCNFDGAQKHKTIIGNRVLIGSDTTLVAPITIHDDVYVAAGTTVREDAPAGALIYNRREEVQRKDWNRSKKYEKVDKGT